MKRILSIVLLMLTFSSNVFAQCAMCKASAETSLNAGVSDAAGINTGVLYVLAITFGILGFMLFLLYKGNKATKPV